MLIGNIDTYHVETLIIKGDMYKLIGYLNQCEIMPGMLIIAVDKKKHYNAITSKNPEIPFNED